MFDFCPVASSGNRHRAAACAANDRDLALDVFSGLRD